MSDAHGDDAGDLPYRELPVPESIRDRRAEVQVLKNVASPAKMPHEPTPLKTATALATGGELCGYGLLWSSARPKTWCSLTSPGGSDLVPTITTPESRKN